MTKLKQKIFDFDNFFLIKCEKFAKIVDKLSQNRYTTTRNIIRIVFKVVYSN